MVCQDRHNSCLRVLNRTFADSFVAADISEYH